MTGAYDLAYDPAFDTGSLPVDAGVRQQIADAVSTVMINWNGQPQALDGQPYRPPALNAWQSFPDWQSSRWLTACVIEHTWLVWVLLPPADGGSWVTALDQLIDPVRSALLKIGNVQRVEPMTLVLAGQTIPALAYTLIT